MRKILITFILAAVLFLISFLVYKFTSSQIEKNKKEMWRVLAQSKTEEERDKAVKALKKKWHKERLIVVLCYYIGIPLLFFPVILLSIRCRAGSALREAKYRIDGDAYSRQIYDDRNNKITDYDDWERIDGLYVSPDNSKMLVWHRPDKAPAYLITLYDLKTKSVVAECEPGMACQKVIWVPDYLIYVWSTTGGGVNYEYRNYENLKVQKTINVFMPFEDPEENILIEANYFYYEKNIAVHLLSDGTVINTINIIEQLKNAGIDAYAVSVQDITKIAGRKYRFDISYQINETDDSYYDTMLELEL